MIPAAFAALAIVGGHPIDLPAAVLVEGAELACTGALVADDVVLSAAHCLQQGGPFAVDGEEVVGWRVHPDWRVDRPGEWDLALLYLGSGRGVLPLALGGRPAIGDPVQHVGLGLAEGDRAPVLRAADAEVVNLFDRVLATEERDGGPCYGDSGGPVLDAMGRLVAVTSFTPDCDSALNGSARVDGAEAWIAQAIADGPPEPGDDDDAGGDDDPVGDDDDSADATTSGCAGCGGAGALMIGLLPGRRRRR